MVRSRLLGMLGIGATLCLSACGGGSSGSQVSSTPPPPPAPPPPPEPPPPPPPPPPITLPAQQVSRDFLTKGATYPASLASIGTGQSVPAPQMADADQLAIRFDGNTGLYEVRLPNSQTWQSLTNVAGTSEYVSSGAKLVSMTVVSGGSTPIVNWSTAGSFGTIAMGGAPIATLSRFASFRGSIAGYSSETFLASGVLRPGSISGTFGLTYNPVSGSLTGSMSPTLTLGQAYTLPMISFTDMAWSAGQPGHYSGRFATTLPGINQIAGIVTDPIVHRTYGGFAFPYSSPIDGRTQQAAGAFSGSDRLPLQ